MIVQCSIMEGQLKNLSESPLKALQGNGLAPIIDYRVNIGLTAMPEMNNYEPGGGSPGDPPYLTSHWPTPYAAVYAYLQAFVPLPTADLAGTAPGELSYNQALSTYEALSYDWTAVSSSDTHDPTTLMTSYFGTGWTWGGTQSQGLSAEPLFLYTKNTTAQPMPYFILRYRDTWAWDSYGWMAGPVPCTVARGVTWTVYQLDLVGSGVLAPGQTIGYGQGAYGGIDIAFPSTNPYAWPELGNALQNSDITFPVLGWDLKAFLLATGFQLGTTTAVTT
ncbi:hypothetical protein [Silvimonas sp.]|uniref:hypothetical protein n=1 Tax=Silvimonas sp. TaxID=2650811 RepID=UPI002841C611|nr:hypothetical protein [Silvimonas sp.]MDR3427861.1 hypothetical protein [Silvimonas sp.]